jgi:archaemetzincin
LFSRLKFSEIMTRVLIFLAFFILTGCHQIDKINSRDKVFLIQPFENINSENVSVVKNALEEHFDKKVYILPAIDLPESAYYSPRNRYRADSLIRYLRRIAPDSCYKIIGLTNKDISTTSGEYTDWGIFGLGFRPGKSCVVSTFRLQRNVSHKKFIERLRKVSIHEIGHNLGLPHCPTEDCVMQDAHGKVSTVDNSKEGFCDKCERKIN